MSCPSQTAGPTQDNVAWENWSRRVSGRVAQYHTPTSLGDLVNVVKRASDLGHQIRVEGSRWSFENIAYSPDWVVNIGNLNQPITTVIPTALNEKWAARQIPDADSVLFHVMAGIMIADLNGKLDEVGLALPTLGGANGQTLAGAISTGTHGGDIGLPPLPDLVMAMHLVTVGGREVWVERASEPITDDLQLALALDCPDTEIIRDDALFNAMLVSMGRFGIIYSYVLRITCAFRLAEWTVKYPTLALTSSLRIGVAARTFLRSLLDTLPDPPPSLGALDIKNPRSLEVAFDTQNLDMCFVKRRWITTEAASLHIDYVPDFLCGLGAVGVLAIAEVAFEAAKAAALLIPVGGPIWNLLIWSKQTWLATKLAENPSMTPGDMLALVLSAMWDAGIGSFIHLITAQVFEARYHDTVSDGKRGPSHLIISGYKEAGQQNCYRADSVEPAFDAWQGGYLDFLDSIVANASQMNQSGYISLRWSATSKALLGMHSFDSLNAVAIEVSSLQGLPDNAKWMTFVESAALVHGGRPHWGQINNLFQMVFAPPFKIVPPAEVVASLYGDRLRSWRESLTALTGGATVFSNAFTVLRGLEPLERSTEPSLFGLRAGEVIAGVQSAILPLLLSDDSNDNSVVVQAAVSLLLS